MPPIAPLRLKQLRPANLADEPLETPVSPLAAPLAAALVALPGEVATDHEQARAEAYTRFQEELGGACDYYWNTPAPGAAPDVPADAVEAVLASMEFYRALAGEYPYDSSYPFCAPAFARYLRAEGIKPELHEDVRRTVQTAVAEGDYSPFWDALRDTIKASRWEFPDKELFLLKVARVGGARVLVEASQLGFVDHRLEHAIVTLQRLYRYRRRRPCPPGGRAGWLAAFEREHHQPEPEWGARLIHLKSFGATDRRFGTMDELDEMVFVRWNRKCIPEFLRTYITEGGRFYDYEFSAGVDEFVRGPQGQDSGDYVDFDDLTDGRRDRLYRANVAYLLDDDAIAKTGILIRLLAERSLGRPFNAARNVLKFVEFTLNEPPPQWVEKVEVLGRGTLGERAVRQRRLVRDTPIAKCYLERLDRLPLRDIAAIFHALPRCLATVGRDLLHRFSKLDVAELPADEVRRWFCDLSVDDPADLCEGSGVPAKAMRRLYNPNAPAHDDAIELCRGLLVDMQARIRARKPLYEYQIWVEPVTVAAVVLPTNAEAKVGRRR